MCIRDREWTEGSAAELLVVADPAWETLPETLPARVLLVSDESTVMAGWAEPVSYTHLLKNGRIFAHRSVDELRETEGMSVDAYFREVFKC